MRIDDILQEKLNALPDSYVKEAMSYSLLAPGKRIRPNFLYAVLKGYGYEESLGDEFASAIEMIHTYSLIHDDLPAMDNDDLRRGLPTCHKKFDEATAILAGDALLTYAFEVASSSKAEPKNVISSINILANMAGASGMVLGQIYDMEGEKGITSFDQIKKIDHYKTGCLLSAPLMIASTLANRNKEEIETWHEVGTLIGLAFQVQDDILDIELTAEEFGKSNSDIRNEKATCVSLLGEEEARKLMNDLYQKGIEKIKSFASFDSQYILKMVDAMITRRK